MIGVTIGEVTGNGFVLGLTGPVKCKDGNVHFPTGLVTQICMWVCVCVCVLLLPNMAVVWIFKALVVEEALDWSTHGHLLQQ